MMQLRSLTQEKNNFKEEFNQEDKLMALFESYERRIDKINEVFYKVMVFLLSKKHRRSQKMPDLMYTIRSKAFSQSVLKTHAGLTS